MGRFTDTHLFQPAANYFRKHECYTKLVPKTQQWKDFWKEERRRCLEGYEVNGVKITGYHYNYLNYFRIDRAVKVTEGGREYEKREFDFPRFYDSDYDFFWLCEIARKGIEPEDYEKLNLDVEIHPDDLSGGKQMCVLKARRKGYSYKAASMLCRNYYHMKRSKNFVFAFDKKYLEGDGIYQKALDGIAFIDETTPFMQPKIIDRPGQMLIKSGYKDVKDGVPIDKGYQSIIQGISLKDNPDGGIGRAGELVFFEEMGKFPGLKKAWNTTHHTVKEGKNALGMLMAWGTGGCLTAGNKVWNNKGELINIEELNTIDGIIGYDENNKKISEESISYWQEPKYKECVKLTTNTRRTIECSLDHPIYTVDYTSSSKKNKHYFKEACDFNIGDKVAIADKVDIFGSNRMWNPYLVGLLIGDGSYGHNQTVSLSNADEEILSYVKENFSTTIQLERDTKDNRIYTELSVLSIRDELRNLGIINQTGLDKTLPENVHQYCKKDLSELLSGLYDADGYINIRKNKNRRTWIAEITLSSMSENLLNEVRFLLQKFGIHGRMRERLPRKNRKRKIQDVNPWYEFTIADKRSLIEFADNINLKCKIKKERLEKIKREFKNINCHSKEKGIRLEKVILIEYTGNKRVYNLTANNTNTYLGNGIITHNTEGADFEGAENLYYEPQENDILRIRNKWDDGAHDSYCGFFIPIYKNLPGFMDEDGNSIEEEAIKYEKKQRKIRKQSKDSSGYSHYIASTPFMPREAIMSFDVNLFPTMELTEQKNRVDAEKRWSNGVPGFFYEREGEIKFKMDMSLNPVYKFPHSKNDDVNGCPVIYEAPFRVDGKVPKDMYIVCHDPYAQDTTADISTASLGAAYVIKRTNKFSPTLNECIVASYVGRPHSRDEYNRNLFMLAEYYGAKIGFENDRGDVYGYAKRHRKLHMLEEQFSFLGKKELQGRTNRPYGMNMNQKRKDEAEIYTRDWLLTPLSKDHEGNETLVLHTINDPALLQELIKYHKKGNFDRVSAIFIGMYHMQEIYNKKVKAIQESKHNEFFMRLYGS